MNRAAIIAAAAELTSIATNNIASVVGRDLSRFSKKVESDPAEEHQHQCPGAGDTPHQQVPGDEFHGCSSLVICRGSG